MTRVARVVAPGVPHHVTQRGNRRQLTFFCKSDFRLYKSLMAEWCIRHNVQIWAYCLMPNHVHLIAVPSSEDGLRRSIGEAHRRYTSRINKRQEWTGHLWQGRFFSYPMDEMHMLMAARYIERNPVRGDLVDRPEDYEWSSAKAHVAGSLDGLVNRSPLTGMIEDWHEFISVDLEEPHLEEIRLHQRTGRPLGGQDFVANLEKETGRALRPQKTGRKRIESVDGKKMSMVSLSFFEE